MRSGVYEPSAGRADPSGAFVALTTARWSAPVALVAYLALAFALLADALPSDRTLVSTESLRRSLPWSAVLAEAPPHNRFLGDQSRIWYPYLVEAARVYHGEADPWWTARGGGGLPFLGNMTSSLLHPFTLLAAFVELPRVAVLQGVLTLSLGAWFTFLFLRRTGQRWWAAMFGGLAFGFGGHQVLWLQYALSNTLVALPFTLWAIEGLVEDGTRRRAALAALGFALMIFGGHPETALVSAIVAGLWGVWRLWDAQGRFLLAIVGLLAVAVSAVQWWPFLEYAGSSHGLWLRRLEQARGGGMESLAATAIFALFFVGGLALVRSGMQRGLLKQAAAVVGGIVVVVMARRMGTAVSGLVMLLPDLYGSPLGGGAYTGAQDYPGLNAGYVGALPALVLAFGALAGLGGGFVRFCAVTSLVLWGAAFQLPAAEELVRAVPGMGQMGPTRLLGPVGFLTACGAAFVLNVLCDVTVRPSVLAGVRRVALIMLLVAAGSVLALRIPVDPHGGRQVLAGLEQPAPDAIHDGAAPVPILVRLDAPADDLRVEVDGRVLRAGRAEPAPDGAPVRVLYDAQRGEEGRHRLRVEIVREGRRTVVADQPLVLRRARQLAARDVAAVLVSLGFVAWLCLRRRGAAPVFASLVVAADVLSFGWGWNASAPADELFPATRTTAFLAEQAGPGRVFSEGTVLPPDTQFAVGVEHLLSYDNLGYHRTYQWLLNVPIDMDAFATYSFSRANVAYDSPRFDVLDVRHVVTDLQTDLGDIADFRLVHESEARVWENTGNMGRAFIVGSALDLVRDAPEKLRLADPRQVALLEEPLDSALGGRGTARVVARDRAQLTVETVVEGGEALLVLVENRGPGWVASIDGGPERPTLACDVAWQALPVPEGRHEVTLRPRSPAARRGLFVSIAAAGLLLLFLLLPRHLS